MKTKLVTMNIDETLLNEWNEYCKRNGITRTELIKDSVSQKLNFEKIITKKLDSMEDRLNARFQSIENFLIAYLK